MKENTEITQAFKHERTVFLQQDGLSTARTLSIILIEYGQHIIILTQVKVVPKVLIL